MRAGTYIRQPEGYRAFIPAPLPPDPPIQIDGELIHLLSEADRALGRLDGVATILPNPDLFVAMYVKQEAVLSSQIEGTQSTLEEVLEHEASGKGAARIKGVQEVVNYVNAMNHGLARLNDLPVCLRLIREIHEKLLAGVRGGERTPGEFRSSQNWIGPAGCTLQNAEFVSPPPHEMHAALDHLEKFLHGRTLLPALIHCGLVHAQFETIHPFLDGNGRMGRLLITFLLCERQILQRPLLYLSSYLNAHRSRYYDRLAAVRTEGDWEGWLRFFLQGVREVSSVATETAQAMVSLREEHRVLIAESQSSSAHSLKLLDFLYTRPVLSIRMAEQHLGSSHLTASGIVQRLATLGILSEITGRHPNRLFRYTPYLALFEPSAHAMLR